MFCFICFSFILIAVLSLFFKLNSMPAYVIGYMVNDPDGISLCFKEYDMAIKGLDIEGGTYFFLPSYIRLQSIDYTASDIRLYTENGELIDKPFMNSTQNVLVEQADGTRVLYRVGFYHSENLYTLNIRPDTVTPEDIEKGVYTCASMKAFNPRGDVVYEADDVRIKGRGNSTWESKKKPYEIRLSKEASLAGLGRSDNWTLLANAKDPTKMKNKIAFDLAIILGMEYVTESEWADLYMNGEYMGNYQICHEPGIGHDSLDITNLQKLNQRYYETAYAYEDSTGKGYMYGESVPYDISGGYLVEYTQKDLYDEKKCGFVMDSGGCFNIKSPDNASMEEVKYISDFTQNVDRAIHEVADGGQYPVIDRASFAKRFLVDEITLNKDAGYVSAYYYKKKGENVLYAGPCWDYDKSCGYGIGEAKDYTGSTLNHRYDYLDWDKTLMADKSYNNYVWSVFAEKSDLIDSLIEKKIDEYYSKISASIEMDRIRWQEIDEPQYEESYDNIRYLKFFLYNRVQYLADKNGLGITFNEPDIYEDASHTLTYYREDGSEETRSVKDGAQVTTDAGMYYRDYPETSTYYVPVFEDMVVMEEGME